MPIFNYLLVYLNLLVHLHTVKSWEEKIRKCNQVTYQNYYTVGIYSACYNQANRTEQNRLAEALDATATNLWTPMLSDLPQQLLSIAYKNKERSIPVIV